MFVGHDLGWWSFWIAIITLFLALPMSMAANIVTPIFLNWVASWGFASLNRRIALLESQLAELEKTPAITDVEDEMLWGLKSLNIGILGAVNSVILVLYVGIKAVPGLDRTKSDNFSALVFLIILMNLVSQMRLRYRKDFRIARSPRRRAGLKKAIEELRLIRESWHS